MINLDELVNGDKTFAEVRNEFLQMQRMTAILKERRMSPSIKKGINDIFREIEASVHDKRALEYWHNKLTMFLRLTLFLDDFGNNDCSHQLIDTGEEIMCPFCGITTGPINEKDRLFITLSAKAQGCFLGMAMIEDIPLINVLKDDIVSPLGDSEIDYMKYYLEYTEKIRENIKIARMLDANIYEQNGIMLMDKAYLSKEKMESLLEELDKSYEEIKNSDSRFSPLFLEMYLTVRYEVLLLGGHSIKDLLNEADSEDKFASLVKAYRHLSQKDFRITSGYFESDEDALKYECLTTNEEINNEILRMRVKG